MEHSLASINVLVTTWKEDVFSKTKGDQFYSFVSPSAYDTAWLGMIPHPVEHNTPLFKGCLEWILNNQNDQGYWGESVNGDRPTIDALSATLTCMAALQKWQLGAENVAKGLKFLHANMEEMLQEQHGHLPRWFSIVFPSTIELAESSGLELKFSDHTMSLISEIADKRKEIVCGEEVVDKRQYPPLLAYLETFQSTNYNVDQETIAKHLSEDGSLFQSPSATAQAYITTRNHKCLEYLISLIHKCPNGVPQTFPMDEELIKLSMVDQVQKLGLSEYFTEDIQNILSKIYGSYMDKESLHDNMIYIGVKLYKDSLAFRLFRLHGYNVSPLTFCWFLHDDEMLDNLENSYGQFTSLLHSVYKATDLMFPGENEMEDARSFSEKLLHKISTMKNIVDDNIIILPNIRKVIAEELSIPWIARLDHLDHRTCIEQSNEPLWVGKASFYTLSCVHSTELTKLAVQNYTFRQLVYQTELQGLKRWSKKWGLTEMGFGREKTMYCYFAVAASTSLPHDSIIRMIVAKSAILITVADDFFDMNGSLDELYVLMEAIHIWDGEGLTGPSKVIFDVLDDLVRDTAKTLLLHGKIDVMDDFKDLWRETFNAWLTETIWGKSGYIPSVSEYLETGMISIATHILVLTSSCFLNPSLTKTKVKPQSYESITQSLMTTTRLLNDIQSYQKEQEEGKMNLVLLHSEENPDASMEDAIAKVQTILVSKRKELLKHVFTDDDNSDFTDQWKYLHLSCFKVFQMLFNSTNLYDSDAELQSDIEKAIYIPPEFQVSKHLKPRKTMRLFPVKSNLKVNGGYVRHFPKKYMMKAKSGVFSSPTFSLCFN